MAKPREGRAARAAPTLKASASTPSGAIQSTQPMMISKASEIASKKPVSRAAARPRCA